jgi:competence protein ComEC
MPAMASNATTLDEELRADPLGGAAMQHRPWNSKSDLSRPLARLERFLCDAAFDRGPWLVVAFGAGIAAWFGLPDHRYWLGLCLGCLLLALIAKLPGRMQERFPRLTQAVFAVSLLVGVGCLLVWVRSALVGAEPIERPLSGTFTARVLEVEEQPALERSRLMLALRDPGSGRAIKVRVNVPDKLQSPQVASGMLIRLPARIMPPAPPLFPGSYDFSRTAWFSGLAASGTATGPPTVIEAGAEGDWLPRLRADLSRHIRSRLGGSEAGIASALATGDRGGIAEKDDQAMRDAGLAHLLSISGLHVSATIGAVYFLALRLLALSPALALRLRLPIVAAGCGALAGIAYTLLTGSEVPTVRSCVAAMLVLAALILGREPLSLRMLATAAFVVLLLWPESLTGPSFQMSFAAVLAIIALATAAPIRRFLGPREEAMPIRFLRNLAMLLVTGLAIELALIPIGFYHFHRAGAYGALANVIAIPLTTFLIMPLVAGALLLDILGLGAPLWWLAGNAIELLLGMAHWISSRPGAVSVVPAMGTWAFLLFAAGGLWLGLWSGRARLLGLMPTAVGVVWLSTLEPPDILVSADGRHVGLIVDDGSRLITLRDTRSDYVRDNLLELAGIEGEPLALAKWPGARCSRDFCSVRMERGGAVWNLLIARTRDEVPERALAAACDRSDIVIADRWLPRSCRPRWLKADRNLLEHTGGLAIRLGAKQVVTVAEGQGEHGWAR